jgi:hypothetical protein
MQRQMNRIVLALLALFAGIAAQVSPAEARVRGATEIGATLNQRLAARVASAVEVAAAFRAEPRAEGDLGDMLVQPLLRAHHFAPSVRIGPDRAHE